MEEEIKTECASCGIKLDNSKNGLFEVYSSKSNTEKLFDVCLKCVKDKLNLEPMSKEKKVKKEWMPNQVLPLTLARNEKELRELFHYTNIIPQWVSEMRDVRGDEIEDGIGKKEKKKMIKALEEYKQEMQRMNIEAENSTPPKYGLFINLIYNADVFREKLKEE